MWAVEDSVVFSLGSERQKPFMQGAGFPQKEIREEGFKPIPLYFCGVSLLSEMSTAEQQL